MAKNIEPNLKNISNYFKLGKKDYFMIPEYQRGYSWTINQCDKLWQDIETFIQSNGEDNYFFGTIIVDCSNNNELHLIDGQQRTTTFLLLLKALLLCLNEIIPKIPNDDDSAGLIKALTTNRDNIISILYKAEPEDIPAIIKDFCRKENVLILENNSINELYKDEIKKIIEAKDFSSAEESVFKIPRKQKDNKYTNQFKNLKYFYERLKDKNGSQINLFAKKLLNECEIIEIRSWNIEQAITMFNSLNSTGLPLSDSDIISAQLYAKTSDQEKDNFNQKWKELRCLANDLESQKITNLDGILQQYMYIHRALKQEYISNKNEGKESIDVTTPGLRRYYTEIAKNELFSDPLSLCDELLSIAKKWDNIKDYPIIKLSLKFNENIKLFLASYLYRLDLNDNKINQDSISIICESLIRLFSLLEIGTFGYSSARFKTFLFGEIIKLVDKNISIESIKKDFDRHISNSKYWEKDDILKQIHDYNGNILVFLNEYLFAKSKGKSFDFSDSVNIEHIMPSSGRNIESIQQDANIKDTEEFDSLVNQIGNKILLEENINKSIGRDWFSTKKQKGIEQKLGYKNSQFAIASSLTNYSKDKWEKDDIITATSKVSERIANFIFQPILE